jgi:phosphatidylinositol alpha-mannosyltransferase
LFLGRLVPRKGCQILLEAAVLLAQQADAPKFRVVICGRGHLEGPLKQFVAKNGLTDVVEFTGFITEADKPRYYASADLSVFPSSGGESFGIVLLEAMASGKATVLAGDNPGYRSVLATQPDLLFDPHDAHNLADTILLYLKDKQLRHEMAVWGENFTKNFDVDTVGQQLLNIYQEALRKRSDP